MLFTTHVQNNRVLEVAKRLAKYLWSIYDSNKAIQVFFTFVKEDLLADNVWKGEFSPLWLLLRSGIPGESPNSSFLNKKKKLLNTGPNRKLKEKKIKRAFI